MVWLVLGLGGLGLKYLLTEYNIIQYIIQYDLCMFSEIVCILLNNSSLFLKQLVFY